MERSKSIRYRPAPHASSIHGESRGRSGLNTFDRTTDTNIFALGDAALDAGFNLSNFDIPDDIFKDFGFSLNDFGRPSDDGSVAVHMPSANDDTSREQTSSDVAIVTTPVGDNKGAPNVKVATISKTLPDGRKVKTRIIQVLSNSMWKIKQMPRKNISYYIKE